MKSAPHSVFLLLAYLLMLLNATAIGQRFTLNGSISDRSTGEVLPGAVLRDSCKHGLAVTTNVYGFYSLTLPAGSHVLIVSSIGYRTDTLRIILNGDQNLNYQMSPITYQQKEVVIQSERADQNVTGVEMGKFEMRMEAIKSLPAFLGEVDLLKAIQLMPGVKSAGDGNTGFYVRGGGPDQNLILLDEAVIYNPSHLLGFFSVFNGDAVSGLQLYKGGMPAQYGGRLASVLDVSMREGNNKKTVVSGGIGLISSRLTIEGPLKKDTASYIISMRRTYADVVATPFIPDNSPFKGSGIFFYDINAKMNWKLNDRNRFFISGYFGRDKFIFRDKESDFSVNMPWGNITTSARWNHVFNRKWFMNTSVIFSDFEFEFGGSQSDFEFKLFSGIRDYTIKSDVHYYPGGRHQIRMGVGYIFHRFTPYNASASQGDVVFDTGKLTRLYAHESAVYLSDDWDIHDKVQLHAGFRFSMFQQVGPFERFNRNSLGQITDTTAYKTNQEVVTYMGPEPRALLRISLREHNSIKLSYTRNLQYIHLASLSAVSLPTDVWVPSTELVKPQIGQQFSAGYFHNFLDNVFETSVEAYYKTMKNQVEYKEGSLPEDNLNDNSDINFTFGDGESYGVEFFVRKRYGKLNGWVGYTLSHTTRLFPEINNGKRFYARYDRRHDGSIVLTYDLNREWSFSAVFVYGTGNAITLPVQRYFIENRIVNEYAPRNSFRMAPYHRLDLSVNFTPEPDLKKMRRLKRYRRRHPGFEGTEAPATSFKWLASATSSWNFSVFNVYNRMNPFFLYFDNDGSLAEGSLQVSAKQVALFPILPSLTWNFKF